MSDRNDKSLVDRLGRFWLIWVFFYLGTGMYAQMQGETSFFAATVDYVPLWVSAIFLNIPLEFLLALTALLLDKSSNPTSKRAAVVLAVINMFLIVGHVVISVVVHFTR